MGDAGGSAMITSDEGTEQCPMHRVDRKLEIKKQGRANKSKAG